MRPLLPLLLLCATSTAALAEGLYVTEGFGGTDVEDELADQMDGALRVRFGAGYRWNRWAIEGWMAGALTTGGSHHGASPPPCDPEWPEWCDRSPALDDHGSALFTYGLDLKYLQPLTHHVEGYLRGGLSYGHLDSGYAGRGLGLGAGVQLKGKVPAIGLLFWPLFFTDWGPKITAAVYAETGYEFYRLHPGGVRNSGNALDAQLHHVTIGFALGSDF